MYIGGTGLGAAGLCAAGLCAALGGIGARFSLFIESSDRRSRFTGGGGGGRGLDLSKASATLIQNNNKDMMFFVGTFN